MPRIPAPDEDASRDPAHAEIIAALQRPGEESEPAVAPAPRRRRATGRRPGPDSNMGLAMYFDDKCPAPSWAHGMRLNSLKGLAAMCREMREHGMDAEKIRALMDLYFARLGERVPRNAYWLDFKGSRWRLLRDLDESAARRTGADYGTWTAAEQASGAEQFAQGWS